MIKRWQLQIITELRDGCTIALGMEWLKFTSQNKQEFGDHGVLSVLPSFMNLVLVGVYRHSLATHHCVSSIGSPTSQIHGSGRRCQF